MPKRSGKCELQAEVPKKCCGTANRLVKLRAVRAQGEPRPLRVVSGIAKGLCTMEIKMPLLSTKYSDSGMQSTEIKARTLLDTCPTALSAALVMLADGTDAETHPVTSQALDQPSKNESAVASDSMGAIST